MGGATLGYSQLRMLIDIEEHSISKRLNWLSGLNWIYSHTKQVSLKIFKKIAQKFYNSKFFPENEGRSIPYPSIKKLSLNQLSKSNLAHKIFNDLLSKVFKMTILVNKAQSGEYFLKTILKRQSTLV